MSTSPHSTCYHILNLSCIYTFSSSPAIMSSLRLDTLLVLCQVGARHDLSAGLLIGGKNVQEERERIGGTHDDALHAQRDGGRSYIASETSIVCIFWVNKGLHSQCVFSQTRLCVGMNILVCTPGRLIQHMDESPSFDATNLQVRCHRTAAPWHS